MTDLYHEYDPDIEVALFEQLAGEYAGLSAAAVAEALRRAVAVVDMLSGGNLYSRGWIYAAARDHLDLLMVRKQAAPKSASSGSAGP